MTAQGRASRETAEPERKWKSLLDLLFEAARERAARKTRRGA